MTQRIVELFVGDADLTGHEVWERDVRDLREGMSVRAEGDPNARLPGTPNESFVWPVSIGDLERDAGRSERANGAFLPLLGPQLLERQPAKREREERWVRENIDG
ncbi:MAG TPA: hypothetical protein VJO33_00995, partial [Gemmatimonadaceae bacterium]|nr:hypothetical protein [Gemmatimonadaceae bacterium]